MIVSYIDHKYNGLRTLSIKMKKKKKKTPLIWEF